MNLAAAFAAGIWAAAGTGLNGCLAVLLAGTAALGLSRWRARRRNSKPAGWQTAAFLLLWLLAGMLRWAAVSDPAAVSLARYEGQRIAVNGTVRSVTTLTGSRGERIVRYEAQLDGIAPRTASGSDDSGPRLADAAGAESFYPVSAGVVMTDSLAKTAEVAAEGDSFRAAGTVRLYHAYHNPGQVDSAAVMAMRGTDGRIALDKGSLRVTRRSGEPTPAGRLRRWREGVRGALTAGMPAAEAALVSGMLFGGYDGIDAQEVRDFASTGIIHILSVSGAHIALVAGAVFWLTRRLSLPDRSSAAAAAAAMAVYGAICGFSAPVARSVAMGLTAMAAIGAGRASYAPRALSLAVLGMLAAEPRNLFDLGFQLSAGCTAGLLFLSPTVGERLKAALPEWAAGSMAATLAAQLAVLPFLAWYFGTFPVVSLAANLLVVPLLEAVILAALPAVLLAGGFPGLTQPLFVIIGWAARAAVDLNRILAGWPGGSVSLPALGPCSGFLYYMGLLVLAGNGRIPDRLKGAAAAWLSSHYRLVRAAGVLALAAALATLLRAGPLQVHFIDVGQGDATLIVTPHGRSVLVDAGGTAGPQTGFDVGERVVVPYLRHYGVRHLDWLILTHNHEDHAGGAAAVARDIGADHVLLHMDDAEEAAAIRRLRQAVPNADAREAGSVGEIMIDGVKIRFFTTGGDPRDGETSGRSADRSPENGRSVVAHVGYGRHSFLLTGDLEGDGEKKLCRNGLLPATVLKVGHHGGKNSTGADFLSRVLPEYAVISVGAGNRFGHPHPETLRRLQEWPLTVLRTDRDGAVVFSSDGESLSVRKYLE